jgi:hypothetical protein
VQYVLVKRKVDGPSIPELGQPVALTFDSVRVPLNRPSTGPNPVAAYQLERSTDGSTWAVIATGASIFGNPPAQYVDGGRAAATTYYYRARTTDTAGRVSAYCATVSVTTPVSPVAPGDWAPNFPVIGAYYIDPDDYAAPSNYSKLAPVMLFFYDHFPYVESGYGSVASHLGAIQALTPATIGAQQIAGAYSIHQESYAITASFYQDVVKKLTDENWWLRTSYPSGSIVPSVYAAENPEINNTEYAHINDKDANGKSWLHWHAEYVNKLNVTGGTFQFPNGTAYTVSANPRARCQFSDNVFWMKKVSGDYNQDGIAESPTNPLQPESAASQAYRVSVQRGYKIHADRLRELNPNVRAFGNMDFFQIADANIYSQSYTPDYTRLGDLLGVMDGGLASEYWLTDSREPFAYEWQERTNGLSGFWTLVNQAKIMHGAVRSPRMLVYSARDILHDGSAADLQRLRFAIGTVCVLTNGAIDDRGVISANSAWHPYYTNNGAGHGWLGQPLSETPSWSPYQNGVYLREFSNGFVAVNPRNNGAQSIAIGRAVRNIVTNVTYTPGQAIPIADRDGLLLLKI